MKRSGVHVCVDPKWEYVFSMDHICEKTDGYYRVTMTDDVLACKSPCAVIYGRPGLYVTGTP